MKQPSIHITNKAYNRFKRYRGYICIGELLKKIRGAMSEQIKIGITLEEEDIGKVRITGNIYAVVKLEAGIWKVKKFIKIHSRRSYEK